MTQEQFDREARYRAAMAIAARMLRQGLISAREYRQIDTMCTAKYLPVIGAFLPREALTSGRFRSIMSLPEGVRTLRQIRYEGERR